MKKTDGKMSVENFMSSASLVRSSVTIYTVMAFVGFEIIWWFHKSFLKVFPLSNHDWYLDLRVTLVSILFLIFGHHTLEEFVPSYRSLKTTFSELFKGLNFKQILLIAFVSSIGEELLFRGAIQPYLGVLFTSLLFAVLHIDPEGKTWAWTVWAFVGGLVMGGAANVTGSLWAPILIHFGVNVISITRVSRLRSKSSEMVSQLNESSGPKV